VLGAGLDTYAYRRTDTRGHVFEVDLPSTQLWKQASLQAAGIASPDSLTFVPTDFQTTALAQSLTQHGFTIEEPAFFSWLGVAMYLPEAAVTETLRFIAGCAPGSGVVFDYVLPASALPMMLRVPLMAMAKHLAARGEPWKSHYAPAALTEQLGALGFSHTHDYTPEELNQRYLSDRSDGLRLGGLTRLMHAQV
jgi:methyltransferase (TIGR00027 family)